MVNLKNILTAIISAVVSVLVYNYFTHEESRVKFIDDENPRDGYIIKIDDKTYDVVVNFGITRVSFFDDDVLNNDISGSYDYYTSEIISDSSSVKMLNMTAASGIIINPETGYEQRCIIEQTIPINNIRF